MWSTRSTLIDEFGADALRFTLALAAGQSRDMRIGPTRVEANRNFAHQAVERRALLRDEWLRHACRASIPRSVTQTVNQWIVAETARAAARGHRRSSRPCASTMRRAPPIISSMTSSATGISKSPSRSSDGTDEGAKAETRATAAWARDQILKLLHPFMPFITEELWARTARRRRATRC